MANDNEHVPDLIDWQLFGAMLRMRRKRLKYLKAEDLSAAIWRHTRQDIQADTIYKIEQGKQPPSMTQMVAICMTLYDRPFPEELISKCASNELMELMEGATPYIWRWRNSWSVIEEKQQRLLEAGLDPDAVEDRSFDPEKLFPVTIRNERDTRDFEFIDDWSIPF